MKTSTLWMISGIAAVVGGILILLNPFVGSITAEILAAFGFLVSGVILLFGIFSDKNKAGTKLWMGLLGAVMVLVGFQLLADPLAGLVSLTFAVGLFIALEAITKLFLSFTLDRGTGFWMMLLSAAVSGLLAFIIFSNFPSSAATTLGIFLGVDLLIGGVSMIALSREMKGSDAPELEGNVSA